MNDFIEFVRNNNSCQNLVVAIKAYRNLTNQSLKQSKAAIDALYKDGVPVRVQAKYNVKQAAVFFDKYAEDLKENGIDVRTINLTPDCESPTTKSLLVNTISNAIAEDKFQLSIELIEVMERHYQ